ncbi:hypothetical protein McanMca71_001819 [Microsporum canis]
MSWLKKQPPASLDTTPQAEQEDKDETADFDAISIYSSEEASNGGHGTDNTLAVTQALEEHDIPCCLVGISALIFYGADRVRPVRIPNPHLDKATELLQSRPYAERYRLVKPWPYYDPCALTHTYRRFKSKGINHYFLLVPSVDVHIVRHPSNFTRSPRGLPYPKLDVFIQSCLDTYSMLPLCDVIDGTNVSEEWGEKNLDLEGTNDVEWAKAKNKKGKEFGGKWAHGAFAREGRKSKREMWQSLVRTKEDRLDWTKPKDVFLTQHRVIGTPDPWTELSDMS